MISERTKGALQAATRCGTKLGSPRIVGGRLLAVGSIKAAADQFAVNVLAVIRELQAAEIISPNAIGGQLNEPGIKTARGGRWARVQVGNALMRGAH
jgi:hypothetical protein